jgi:hypothetical protein
MKHLSLLTLAALLSVSSCSHFKKSCCAGKDQAACAKESCAKPCCDKEKKTCMDGSCEKPKAAADCGDSCHKNS